MNELDYCTEFFATSKSFYFFNSQSQSGDDSLDDEDEELLRHRLRPDYNLYNHFSKKFDDLIQNYGREQMKTDVVILKEIVNNLKEDCQFFPAIMKKKKYVSILFLFYDIKYQYTRIFCLNFFFRFRCLVYI